MDISGGLEGVVKMKRWRYLGGPMMGFVDLPSLPRFFLRERPLDRSFSMAVLLLLLLFDRFPFFWGGGGGGGGEMVCGWWRVEGVWRVSGSGEEELWLGGRR